MKSTVFFILLLSGAFSFNANANWFIQDSSRIQSDSLPDNILIINSFDAKSIKARDKKKQLFQELTDSLKSYLQKEIEYRRHVKTIVLPDQFSDTEVSDSVIFSMMLKNNSSGAIVIRKLNVYFEQKDVEVFKEEDGKKRLATYDICADVTYNTYIGNAASREAKTHFCEFFTKRWVASGLLAAGPDVVGKSRHTFSMVEKNAYWYVYQNWSQ
jgi:hypothetical protein